MNYFRRFRDAAISVALLALPFFFLRANLKDPSRLNVLDRLVLQASAPIQYVATRAADAVSSALGRYVYLVEVQQDNDRLREENLRLTREVRELRREKKENAKLRGLLQLREALSGDELSAQVVGKEISEFFRVIRVRLDRGERDRVRAGMPVVSVQGLVGQVDRTQGRYSDVRLTVDRMSAVDVIVQRTGARGMLRGTGEPNRYLCRIQYLNQADDVQVGDQVYTSGFGQRFPSSLLVGHVTKVARRAHALYQEVEVAPAVNFSALEKVLILTSGSPSREGDPLSLR